MRLLWSFIRYLRESPVPMVASERTENPPNTARETSVEQKAEEGDP